jgi:Uma2 family endonuclease
VASNRYRVPDLIVVREPVPADPVLLSAPYICIEILSPDDSPRQVRDRFDDYIALGVPNNWLLDPDERRAWIATSEGYLPCQDGVLRTIAGDVALPIADLFDDT